MTTDTSARTAFDELEEHLAHYGVKGMKWGVRRTEAQLARARKKRAKEESQSEDAKTAAAAKAKAKTKGVDSLSNAELRVLNERLNLERNYDNLTSGPDAVKKLKRGNDAVRTVMATGATVSTVAKFAKSDTGKAIGNAVINALSVPGISDVDLKGL